MRRRHTIVLWLQCRPKAPDRVDYLNNLGAVWRNHYTHTGLEADLQTALNYYREADPTFATLLAKPRRLFDRFRHLAA